MARPQIVSDAEILIAARRVIGRRGYDQFTLSEVADEVGLSRGAIILRFKSTQALKAKLASHMIASFISYLRALPVLRSGDGLIHFAAAIGALVRQESLASFMVVFRGNLQDPDLAKLERERAAVYHEAIAARMPRSALPRDAAATLFQAVLGGAIMQWEVQSGVGASDFLVARAKDWLTLARIDFSKDYTASLESRELDETTIAPMASARAAKRPAVKQRRPR